MPLSRLWRAAIAAPATALLAVGGVMITAAPAQAAPGTLIVSAPTDGAALESRSVDVVGTGTDGATVLVATDTGVFGPVTVTDGAFTVPVAFADDAVETQSIAVVQTVAGDSEPDELLLTVTLPPVEEEPATPAGVIEVTSPREGETLSARTVTYTGTAPVGATLTASTEYPLLGELTLGSVPVDADGNFTFVVPFAPATENPVSVTFSGVDADGIALEAVTVSNDLPDPVAAPVITAPTSAAIVGTSVTFSGTGIPGNGIALVVVAADEASAAALSSVDPLSLATPIIVQPDGTWTATYTLAYGSFAVTAVHTSDPTTTLIPEILSLPSEPVAFSLVAPIVTASASNTGPMLAETGPAQAGFLAPAALLFLGAGALLMAARRRAARS
ncbi:hypothetical protein ACFSBZ_11385 [Amnibacterium flavum]|uniref:Gram-positive cocci surface proteins LPxTG domain-containing protein n=1 Tax=Amnibacterium flavum TaxID=2173173 RepID=A0A2V1HSW1_9MICO|nr:hypothetical protein [Amnibacterium flavum]PVZ95421.1 hypothetical protein DDQ50_02605 [Amnibacterium flavum]